ncbi:MAG: hypothetical protein R3B47_17280 [Bacteroidia bacterium]
MIAEDLKVARVGTNRFVTDYNTVNTSNLLLGGAVVYPYWQFEAGYNFLQNQFL